jgi:uncharacterized repeat protein (TIGR01451 family)
VVTTPAPVVSITKSVDVTTITPGGTAIYTITVTNTSNSVADGTLIADPIPTGIDSFNWTCTASGGAACPHAAGAGAIHETITNFPGGGELIYTITAVFSASPPAQIINVAQATPPDGSLCAPGNTPPPCTGTAVLPAAPVLEIVKSASSPTILSGGTVTFTVVVTNTTIVSADGATISDPIPAGITAFVWTCTADGGAVCPNAAGSGAISETIATFPGGGAVTYDITATVASDPPASITNTASTTPPGNGLCGPGNTAPPCTATAVVAAAGMNGIPTLSWSLLFALLLMLAAAGWYQLAR